MNLQFRSLTWTRPSPSDKFPAIMKTNYFSLSGKTVAFLILLFAPLASAQTKRPLTHQDYDGWRNIQNQTLSNDGKFLAYGLFPQEGDGEVVVRNLQTGTEWRQPAGARPAPGLPDPESDQPPPVPQISISFTADSHYLVFPPSLRKPTQIKPNATRSAPKKCRRTL